MGDLAAFFHPSSIAVIGASESAGKLGHEILKNLLDGGFPGALYPINPKSERILGLACSKNIKEVPDDVDLAVVIIPAKFVPQAIQDCGEKGVKAAVIISGGFSEAGPEGERLQQQVAEIAKQGGVRLIGPNCQGVNNPYHPCCASWPLLRRKGHVAILSQSGTVGAAMMDWFSFEELGVSSFVSLGNRADVDEIELIEYFEDDPNTKVIAAYLEGVKDPVRFRNVLQSLRKPLVVLKSGRTPGGKVAAESHTKSLAGADAIYSSLFNYHKICRAQTIEEFFDFAKAFAYLEPPEGNRILFVTTSGGAAILATDTAEQEGLVVAPLPKELGDELSEVIPAHAIRANPLDLTGDANATMFQEVIQRARPHYDILGIIFGDPVLDASQVVTPGSNELVIFLGGAEVERAEKLKMHSRGIPVFPTPERGIRALAQVLPAGKKNRPAQYTLPQSAGRSQLGLFQSLQFMQSKGFDCIVSLQAESPGKAVHLAHQLGFPVSLKIDSPDILHKSDFGGVKLNLQSSKDVRKAYDDMMQQVRTRSPQATIRGAVVSAMAAPGLEVIMGMNRDPQFGPVILFGLGGITVELFRDVSMRLLPLDHSEAAGMLREIKGAPLLKGFRGHPAVDEEALIDGLLKLAEIAQQHQDIMEIDLNPVFAYPEGMVVVDARILKA
ncbi:acetate--CoA ligase family protein [Desulfoferrobacter suflitae]|uniref:acetate--CoA ligase family protein n=1 Tax=Desulfoferrobacter suflitae TaxID=2865782 RepID=UPI0021643FB2|nr:acetate--CoA ligase family protein [Desulfoferrobacter suflitae]MCK8602465.1 acetate--CoA ligase family protein [Desulfoferrobacter suflitae]